MPKSPSLYVEGKDDKFTIANVLKRHNLELKNPPLDPLRPVIHETSHDAESTTGVDKLIANIVGAIRVAEAPVGFVIDADPDKGLAARWQSVRDQLAKAAVAAPVSLPPEGFIGESTLYKVRAGVWLMPDNKRDGTLETFLQDLIDQSDLLIEHAKASTAGAAQIEQRFANPAKQKAELCTWLAWQEDPGCPYGTAVNAQYFRVDSPAALSFVLWFRTLFGL